jgi:hypothetical protein
MKNKPCRYTDYDSGLDCYDEIHWALDDIRVREHAEWFDWSKNTYIECVVESLAYPMPMGSVAAINVSIVNTTVLLDTERLSSQLATAKLNFNCAELSHCTTKDSDGIDIDWFGSRYEYTGATQAASQLFTFTAARTPVVTSISPERAMQGQLVEIHGYNFDTDVAVTDTNWYMTEFGFFEQPVSAWITIGTYQCKLAFHNDTLITCNAVYGEMYKPHAVELTVHGLGNAISDSHFTFAVDIYSVQPLSGSAAGGTTITIETSVLNTDAGFEGSTSSSNMDATDAGNLGFTTFGIWMIENLDLGLSNYIADYLGINMGEKCKPIARLTTSTSLTCVTLPPTSEAATSVPTSDTVLKPWLIAEWNGNEIYSKCHRSGNCSFTFALSMTPVLTFNKNESSLAVPEGRMKNDEFSSVSGGFQIVASGDVLRLSAVDTVYDVGVFNWVSRHRPVSKCNFLYFAKYLACQKLNLLHLMFLLLRILFPAEFGGNRGHHSDA